jgi:HlyD family secretion protein
VLGLGGFALWSSTASLSSAAVAPGAVQVDSNRKAVQHLEGGIVREILVREGQRVREGDVLVRLDEVAARADRDLLHARLVLAVAEEARLTAERDGADTMDLPGGLPGAEGLDAAGVEAIIAEQREIFARRRSSLDNEITVHMKRIERQRSVISTATRQIQPLDNQLALMADELKTAKDLLAKGWARKPQVLELERRHSALESERAELDGRIAGAKETIYESEAQIAALRSQRASEVTDELSKARSRRAEAEEQMRKAGDKLRRIEITAPQDGVVLGMKYFTPGAVVPPGGDILELVPENERLVVEVRVNPLDIDVVHEGLPAQVRLVAFKQRVTPTVSGRVTRVSADALLDQKTGAQYYLARVELDAEEMAALPDAQLYPGMPAEALILTGERTFLGYLSKPILDSFAHAFREE